MGCTQSCGHYPTIGHPLVHILVVVANNQIGDFEDRSVEGFHVISTCTWVRDTTHAERMSSYFCRMGSYSCRMGSYFWVHTPVVWVHTLRHLMSFKASVWVHTPVVWAHTSGFTLLSYGFILLSYGLILLSYGLILLSYGVIRSTFLVSQTPFIDNWYH